MNVDVSDVSVVICTMNSIQSIRECLLSVVNEGAGQIIVVDASSTDGTRDVADELANLVLTDPGQGLGRARNMGIQKGTGELLLILGSDNVMTPGSLRIMINNLVCGSANAVGALTHVPGTSYLSRGLNFWRVSRFRVGPVDVVGSPTLFWTRDIQGFPFNIDRRFSDDTELCERWSQDLDAKFAISPAVVLEIGKTGFRELKDRCKIYGISDSEIYRDGVRKGWTRPRRIASFLHPIKVDLVTPIARLGFLKGVYFFPYFCLFVFFRYKAWMVHSLRHHIT